MGRVSLLKLQFQNGQQRLGHNGVEASDLIEILIHKLTADQNPEAVRALFSALQYVKDNK